MASLMPDDVKEKIRAASPITEVAADLGLNLEADGDLYKSVCFNPHGGTPDTPIMEESASLKFYVDSNTYYCYGCGMGQFKEGQDAGNDVFGLVANFFKITAGVEMSFLDTMRWLVDRARKQAAARGETFDVRIDPPAPPDPEAERQKKQKTETNRKFYDNLMADLAAREFLYARGLTDEDFGRFRIGLTLQDHPWQLVRNRIAFGITEVRNDEQNPATIGFSYREIPGRDCEGDKYILDYEKGNKVFSRSNTLYLLHDAIPEIRRRKYVHMVEGCPDAIWMHKVGRTNAVATFGTAVSAGQLDVLRKHTGVKKVLYWVEDDAAANKFIKQIDQFLSRGFEVFVVVTGGKDPDEIAIKYGANGIDSYVASKARPALQYFTEQVASAYHAAIHDAKKKAVSHLIPMIQSIPNKAERAIIIGQLEKTYEISFGFLETIQGSSQTSAVHTSSVTPNRIPIRDLPGRIGVKTTGA